jgi:ADP-heptose:LPS heptosyltransferase
MKKNILCFFRAGLGDFYLSFPLFYTLRNTYKKDKITLVAPLLAADLLHGKEWVDEIVAPNNFVPERKYDKVYDLDITRTGRSAIFKPEMDHFDIFESTYDISFGDRKKFPEIFKLNTIDSEKEKVDALIERHSTIDSKNVVIHTTHTARTPKGKTPPLEWWNELLSVFPQHRFYQVGTPVSMGERVPADFNFGNRLTNLTDQRGFLNLRQVAYLIEQTDFFIGVDSVVQHLSLSSKKKGLVIYGSSDCKMAKHDHNHNLSSHRPCSPCIDNANNMNCCLMNRPDLWPKIDTVSRILRENFLLSPPKKSEWLIADPVNKEQIKRNL